MPIQFRRLLYTASTALGLSLAAFSAFADPALPNLENLDFSQYTGTNPKGTFTSVDPVGWTGGTGLIFIDGAAYNESAEGGGYLPTYGNPAGSVTGNYVEADGNPSFTSGFNYTVTGLTVGQTYTLSFYQGASEQTGFGMIDGQPIPTTNQWIVSLGTSGLTVASGGPNDPTYGPTDVYSNADSTASITASPLMSVCYQCTVGWNYVTVNLTADATTDVLSFLAWGDNGSTVNLPPIAFLSGIDSPDGLGVPEPASLTLLGVGLLGLRGIARRRRGKRSSAG